MYKGIQKGIHTYAGVYGGRSLHGGSHNLCALSAHRQGHNPGQYGGDTAHRRAAHFMRAGIPGLRRDVWPQCGGSLHRLCQERPAGYVLQYSDVLLRQYRQVFHRQPYNQADYRRYQNAARIHDAHTYSYTEPADADIFPDNVIQDKRPDSHGVPLRRSRAGLGHIYNDVQGAPHIREGIQDL